MKIITGILLWLNIIFIFLSPLDFNRFSVLFYFINFMSIAIIIRNKDYFIFKIDCFKYLSVHYIFSILLITIFSFLSVKSIFINIIFGVAIVLYYSIMKQYVLTDEKN